MKYIITMKLGFIGLGKMGSNMVQRLLLHNHEVVVFDFNTAIVSELESKGAIAATDIEDMIQKLPDIKIVWLMVPAGKPVDDTITKLLPLLQKGDILIDGGNSFWKDSQTRAERVAFKGVEYVDCGTSGGVWGLQNGYCLMYGGTQVTCNSLEPIFASLATENGYLYCGKSGAGHFVKMVHNGIEYGMMQAFAEGFELMEKSPFAPDLDKVAELWRHGSVVRSWLLDLIKNALDQDPKLDKLSDYVEDNGEARWMIQSAMDFEVPVHVTAASLFTRFESRQNESFAMKMLAAMRNQFGGHAIKTK